MVIITTGLSLGPAVQTCPWERPLVLCSFGCVVGFVVLCDPQAFFFFCIWCHFFLNPSPALITKATKHTSPQKIAQKIDHLMSVSSSRQGRSPR